MTKKVILIVSTLVAFYYCFRFGYIWTAYGHGGQLLGIPFAFILVIATAIFFLAKTKTVKAKAFIFSIIYFLTLVAFSVTIELIRASMENYFDFLYVEPGGNVDKIFLGWLIAGAIIFFLFFRQIKTSKID